MTPADLMPLDFTLRGLPFGDVGLIDAQSLDYTLRGWPEYVTYGTTPYNPNMATEFSVSFDITASLSTQIQLVASFTIGVEVSAFMNLGVSAKLVNVF